MFMINKSLKVPDIRILPMSKKEEFQGNSILKVQQEYFEYNLINKRDSKFYYISSGLKKSPGSLILFQYDNKIIASAQLKDREEYNPLYEGRYKGALILYGETIQVFEPIELSEIQSIDPKITEFSRTKWFVDINKINDILLLLEEKRKLYNKTYEEKVDAAEVDDLQIQDKPKDKIEIKKGNVTHWPRDPKIGKRVIINSKYECFFDKDHKYFVSKLTRNNYVESHHIIPIGNQDQFDKSIDVEANIACLCPVCHRILHHAKMADKLPMLQQLYNDRKDRLKDCGIVLTIKQLEDYYK